MDDPNITPKSSLMAITYDIHVDAQLKTDRWSAGVAKAHAGVHETYAHTQNYKHTPTQTHT